jgi:phage-related tail fiber protein
MSTNQLTPNRKVGTDFTGKLNTYSESGMIAYFAMQTPPTGWVECDGANYSNTMYPELYTAIGITYGGTLKNGTFNVPDLRGNFIRCLNYSATGTDPNRTLSGTPQASSAILNYTPGTDTAALFNHPNNTAMNTIKFGEPSTVPFVDPMVLTYSPDTKNTGEASYKSIRPQNIAMLACIKT